MTAAPVFKFHIGPTAYELRLGDLTPRDSGDFRREVGMPLMQAFGATDLDVIAGFVWLIRRRAQRNLSYAEVADSFTYADYLGGFDADGDGSEAEDPTDPPA